MRPTLKKHDKHTPRNRVFAKGRHAAREHAILGVFHNSFSASRLQTFPGRPGHHQSPRVAPLDAIRMPLGRHSQAVWGQITTRTRPKRRAIR